MERGADVSLHQRLMGALARAERAQDDSRAAVETHAAIMGTLQATVDESRTAHEARRAFAIRQARVQNRSRSG